MLHIGRKTIAFRKGGSRYFWIGEQESFQGPKEYKTVDGTFREQIVFTFEKEPVSGFLLNRLNISYNGEDARLVGRSNLSLDDVKPILREWSTNELRNSR